ncbi:MAG: hypothetical protein KGJ07_05020, partial [Patescibacteria group bacterium]|nr:hypothetical protein [Patescibacteria group bacterium]
MARTAEITGSRVMPSLDGQLSGGREGSADFQVFLRNRGAIAMGNKALFLLPQLFDKTHHYIIASLGGTFDYPFTRDALISAHLTRKALETFFGGFPLNRPDLIANESLETIPRVVDIGAGSILQEVGDRIKRSNTFFSDHQKSNGAYPHEMQPYQKGHPFLKSKFYTWKRGDEFMLNSDSIDATPRALMEAVNTLSSEEVAAFYPKAEKAFNWIIRNMREHHGFLAYEGNLKGLMSQGWMDSQQGRPLDQHGDIIPGSVALIEVQAQVWSAMTRWVYLLEKTFPDTPENKKYHIKARQLRKEAQALKARFNNALLNGQENPHTFRTPDGYFAHALVYPPGQSVPIQDMRVSINAGIALEADHQGETIFANNEDIKHIVHNLLS